MQSSKEQQGEIRKPSSEINAKKQRKTIEWERSGTDLAKVKVKESEVAQSCLTLCDPMDCSPPGSSIHGILQARILEWAAISFSRGIFPTIKFKLFLITILIFKIRKCIKNLILTQKKSPEKRAVARVRDAFYNYNLLFWLWRRKS